MPSDTRYNLSIPERQPFFCATARPGFRQAGFHGAGKGDLLHVAGSSIDPFSRRPPSPHAWTEYRAGVRHTNTQLFIPCSSVATICAISTHHHCAFLEKEIV